MHRQVDKAPHEWQIVATLTVDDEAVTRTVRCKAAFLVATYVIDSDQLSEQELIQTYKARHSVERGFAFLKDPLVLRLEPLHQQVLTLLGPTCGQFYEPKY